MQVLWLVSITIPAAAAACGLPAKEVGGGWLTGQLEALRALPDAPAGAAARVVSAAGPVPRGAAGGLL